MKKIKTKNRTRNNVLFSCHLKFVESDFVDFID